MNLASHVLLFVGYTKSGFTQIPDVYCKRVPKEFCAVYYMATDLYAY